MTASVQHTAPMRPQIQKGALVQMDGLAPGSYRVREVRGSSVEVEHAATGAPAGIWPIDVTVPVPLAGEGDA